MKKTRVMIVVVLAALLLSACKFGSSSYHPDPLDQIILNNMDDYNKLKAALETDDAEIIDTCLKTLYIASKEEAREFVEAFESLPVINVLDGTISLLMSQRGTVTGKDIFGRYYDTGKRSDWLLIETTAEDGSWVWVDYWLGDNGEAEKSLRSTVKDKDNLLSKTFTTENGRITVYSEKRQPHPTKDGDMIDWLVKIDNMYAEIKYFSQNIDSIKTEAVFNNAQFAIGKLD